MSYTTNSTVKTAQSHVSTDSPKTLGDGTKKMIGGVVTILCGILCFLLTSYFKMGEELSVVFSVILSCIVLIIQTIYFYYEKITRNINLIQRKVNENSSSLASKVDINCHTHDTLIKLINIFSNSPYIKYESILRKCDCKIPNEIVSDAWKDFSLSMKSKYSALNYEKLGEAYKDDVAKECLEIHYFKRKQDVSILKVFVIDSEEELESKYLHQAISAHQKGKIKTRYILKEKIFSDSVLSKRFSMVESLDFSIIDESMVFQWNLDEDRNCIDASLIFDEEKVLQYKLFYAALRTASVKFDQYSINEVAA